MPNHFHLLITPAYEIPLEKAVQFIKGGFSYRAKKELNYRLDVWERGFKEHRIKDADDYEHHGLYIHENPVRGGLVRTAAEYPYSSAHSGALR